MDEIKILEEADDYYIGEIDGKSVKLFKIDTDKMKIERNGDLHSIAGVVDVFKIAELLIFVDELLSSVISIDDYESIANNVVGKLKVIETQILRADNIRNFCFQYIKQMDTQIYGKAQTFKNHLKWLYMDLIQISHFMKTRGLWNEFSPETLELVSFHKIKNEFESNP